MPLVPIHRLRRPAVAVLVLLLVVAGSAGCGGDADGSPPVSGLARSADAAVATALQPAPLFGDDGRPLLSLSALVPLDSAARTRAGLYASAAQYEWEALTVAAYTVLVDLDALGADAAALAAAAAVRERRDSAGVAYYVRARDPVRAARLADALGDRGFTPVFVVRSANAPG